MQALIAMIITQALAFAILFLILKKFAFGPVLNLIDSRRRHISDEFESIESGKAGVLKSQKDIEQRLAGIDDEARIKVRDAVQEGQQLAEQISTEAQQEAQEIARKAESLIEIERTKFTAEIRDRVIEMTIAATEKLIRERLDEEKHREIIINFIDSMPTSRT